MRFSERAARFGAGSPGGAAGPGGGDATWALSERAAGDAAAGRRVNGHAVILAGVGEPDFAPPLAAVEAAVEGLEAERTGYAPIAGDTALRRAVAEMFDASVERLRPRVRWRADNVAITPGAQGALYAALQVLIDEGDEVVAPSPMYPGQARAIAAAGGRLRTAPLSPENGFRPDSDSLEAAITPRTRVLILTTPNNPTGAMADLDELRAIADLAVSCDLWVVSDEVYGRLAYDRPHLSIAALPGMAERTVTLDSVSKAYAMTGWRVGWAIGPRDVVRLIEGLLHAMTHGAPPFTQAGALAALTAARGANERMRAAYRRRRDLLGRVLAASARERPSDPPRAARRGGPPLLRLTPPEGGLFAMIDARGLAQRHGVEPGELADAVYEETGVAALDGGFFGPEAAGFLRVTLALDEEQVAEMSARIARLAALEP